MEKLRREFNRSTYLLFIDFVKDLIGLTGVDFMKF